jgi:hypothetical protein
MKCAFAHFSLYSKLKKIQDKGIMQHLNAFIIIIMVSMFIRNLLLQKIESKCYMK